MGKTNGPVLHRFYIESLPNSVKPVGMSGWIQATRKQNEAEKKMKNFFIGPS